MSTRKILLVDDSKSARYALRLMLKKHDYDVDMAESAEIALEKVREQKPDAIFMDHLMPGMNGFEALDVLKSDGETAHIPVVMCTSNDEEPYQIQARDKGALGILPKPATPEKLNAVLEAIETAIERPEAAAAAAVMAFPTSAAAPALDEAAISSLISTHIRRLMDTEVRPLLGESLDRRLEEVKSGIFEGVMERSAAQIDQWMDAEMAQIREQLAAPTKSEDLSAKLDDRLQEIKSELVKMETDHAQAVVQKINNEVLPDLVGKQLERLERHLHDLLELRIGELSDRLVEELPANDRLIRKLSEIAEAVAEQKAEQVASTRAQEIAEYAAGEKTDEVSEFLLDTAENSQRRMYLLAGAAAGVGILSSLIMYLLT